MDRLDLRKLTGTERTTYRFFREVVGWNSYQYKGLRCLMGGKEILRKTALVAEELGITNRDEIFSLMAKIKEIDSRSGVIARCSAA